MLGNGSRNASARPAAGIEFVQEQRASRTTLRCWSTEDVEQSRALEYWIDTVCEQFLALEIDSPVRERFRGRLEQVDLGVASMSVIEAHASAIRRTHDNIARSSEATFVLLQMRRGCMRLKQIGCDSFVGPGESILIDAQEPYDVECPEVSKAVLLLLPDQWLRRWVPCPAELAPRLFSGGGWSAVLNAALATLDDDASRQFALPNNIVAEQLAALLALAAGPTSPAIGPPKLLELLHRTLRDRLHEADLSPSAVAEIHGISTRSVHYAFARARTTFMKQLTCMRIERAAETLSDGRLADLPITEVAARCGFTDPSHFARRFRRQFGQSPLSYRHAALLTKP